MSTPGIIERRRRLNAERSEAIERHEVPLESYNTACSEVPIPQSNQSPVKYAALISRGRQSKSGSWKLEVSVAPGVSIKSIYPIESISPIPSPLPTADCQQNNV